MKLNENERICSKLLNVAQCNSKQHNAQHRKPTPAQRDLQAKMRKHCERHESNESALNNERNVNNEVAETKQLNE